ncbi:MAG: hypothetical protein ACRD96_04780 [Bryobacteraceae bacterium]
MAWPQQPQQQQPQQQLVQSGGIKVLAVQGEGAINSIRTKTATPIVVEVRDDKDQPVAGAEIVFQLPAAGPGGVFHGWMRNQTARTNEKGQAGTSGFAPNDEEGRFNVKVTATHGMKTAGLVVGQSNGRGNGGAQARTSRKGLWATLAILGGAGLIGGVVAASSGDNGTVTTPKIPVTITPGAVTVGGPR